VVAGAEPDHEEQRRPLEPLAQLHQVVAQRKMDVVFGSRSGLPRLRQRGLAHDVTLSASFGREADGAAGVGDAAGAAPPWAMVPAGGTRRSWACCCADSESGSMEEATRRGAAARLAAARAEAGSAGAAGATGACGSTGTAPSAAGVTGATGDSARGASRGSSMRTISCSKVLFRSSVALRI